MKPLPATFTMFLLLLMGCDPQDGKLTLVNNTSDKVYYSISYDSDSISSYPVYMKDSTKNDGYEAFIDPDTVLHLVTMDTWEYNVNEKCKDSTLRIFFFTNDLIKLAGKDSIMKYQLYSKKEKLKVKDLEKLNWRQALHVVLTA